MGNPNGWSLGGALGGAALSGAFGLIGSAMQHKYEKENMALQNEYAMQAEERANAFNAPSAVRARMESAGMNPAAFMGQTSGAGIQGGMSSAPTPSTSASVGSIDTSGISNIGSVMAQQRANDINEQRMKNDAEKTYQEAKKIKLENDEKEYMREQGVWASRVKDENAKAYISSANAIMAKIRSESYDIENKANIEEKKAHAEEMRKHIEHFDALIDRIKTLTDDEKALFKAQADKYREEARKQKADNDLYSKIGVRPGMDWKTALVSIGANILGWSREKIESWVNKYLSDNGISPNDKIPSEPSIIFQTEKDRQDALDEYKKLVKTGKDAYEEEKLNFIDRMARSFKY